MLSEPITDLRIEIVGPDQWQAHVDLSGDLLTLPLEVMEGQARILDLDAAEFLGFNRDRKVRDLIRRLLKDKFLKDIHQRTTVERADGQVAPQTTTEYWLTRKQLLLLATQSEAPRARALTAAMVDLIEAVLNRTPDNYVLPPILPTSAPVQRSAEELPKNQVLAPPLAQRAYKWATVPWGETIKIPDRYTLIADSMLNQLYTQLEDALAHASRLAEEIQTLKQPLKPGGTLRSGPKRN